MENLNKYGNRRWRQAVDSVQLDGRNEFEWKKFTLSGNVPIELTVADPFYRFTRTLTGTPPTADAIPTGAVPPVSQATIWDLTGFAGLNCYVVITGGIGPTVSLELYCLDQQNNEWFKVGEAHGVASRTEVRFNEMVRGRTCFVRVLNIPAAVTEIKFYGTAE
jgi:hypothetical protein